MLGPSKMARWLSASEACALAMGLSSDQPLPPLLLRVMKKAHSPPGHGLCLSEI